MADRTAAERVSGLLVAADLERTTARSAASVLGMSFATMYRLLQHERTSWNRLLDAERRRRCEALLAQKPEACMTRVARRLGCSLSTANTSMRRWYGASLRDLQKLRVAGGEG